MVIPIAPIVSCASFTLVSCPIGFALRKSNGVPATRINLPRRNLRRIDRRIAVRIDHQLGPENIALTIALPG